MYSLIDLEKDIENLIQELSEVRAQKGHDYSGTEDTFANLRAFGWQGVVVRLGDKFHRLANFMKSGGDLRVKDEKIEDTMQDFVNYALFMLILYRQAKETEWERTMLKDIQAETKSSEEGFASKAPLQVRSLGEIEQDAYAEPSIKSPPELLTLDEAITKKIVKRSKGMIVAYEDLGEV